MKKIKEISVFFPCFNEQDNIRKLTQNSIDVLDEIADDYQILIVNDGSSDNTADIAADLVSEFKRVELINHEVNKGYGAALRTGFLNSTRELVFYTDGDNQFDISELPRLLELKDKYDIVSCYRIKRHDPFMRKINANLYNLALFFLFGLKVKDVDCAFKLYRKDLFERIDIYSDGALVDAEILIKAKKLGYTIGQCGVHHYPRTAGKQTGANIRVIFRAFKEIIKLRLRV